MRGKHTTKPIEEVMAEAQQLADSGAREQIIVSQETTYYGMDMCGDSRLAELLEKLNAVEGFGKLMEYFLGGG